MEMCVECGTDHEGWPEGSMGAAVRCIRARAEALSATHLMDQVDAFERDRGERAAAQLRRAGLID